MIRIVENGLLHCTTSPALITDSGDKLWYSEGHLHRDNGPAIEHANGAQEWWIHGFRHRDIDPAVITPLKTEWWHYGHLHREDGPAVIYSDNTCRWACNDVQYNFDEWCNKVNVPDTTRLLLELSWNT